MKDKKEWYIDEIIAEKLCCHDYNIMKWFQVKYMSYTVPEWNWAINMKDITVLK